MLLTNRKRKILEARLVVLLKKEAGLKSVIDICREAKTGYPVFYRDIAEIQFEINLVRLALVET